MMAIRYEGQRHILDLKMVTLDISNNGQTPFHVAKSTKKKYHKKCTKFLYIVVYQQSFCSVERKKVRGCLNIIVHLF